MNTACSFLPITPVTMLSILVNQQFQNTVFSRDRTQYDGYVVLFMATEWPELSLLSLSYVSILSARTIIF